MIIENKKIRLGTVMTKKIYTSLFIIAVLVLIFTSIVYFNRTNGKGTPNSIVLTLTEQPEQIEWNHLKLRVGQLDGPGDYVSIPNHSEITNTETIKLPVGEATMIRFSHGGPAVNPVPDQIIYWIYVQRSIPNQPDLMRTYYLEGEVIGDHEQLAKDDLIQIAQTWNID
ncbi:hypothetical protein [Paenibacillus segetis]|uniref:Uncharacterized protein n=1 Tax=Paenibacillus segetis TaxID=1325360 RepID=A0ABQ1YK64_9BACL|nr:hypothetical protein [Paenibacillus segetis]GGH27156.1 hypothetical protein GCM10008013_28450 [Paenibacillus segetis]